VQVVLLPLVSNHGGEGGAFLDPRPEPLRLQHIIYPKGAAQSDGTTSALLQPVVTFTASLPFSAERDYLTVINPDENVYGCYYEGTLALESGGELLETRRLLVAPFSECILE
jgi:hypothetical protein